MKQYFWFLLVLGIWILLSPWILGFSSYNLARWNNIIAGVAIFLVSLWALFGENKGN